MKSTNTIKSTDPIISEKETKTVVLKDLDTLVITIDHKNKSIIFNSDYDLVFKSKGNILNLADGLNIQMGSEVHLNPDISFISKTKNKISHFLKLLKYK